MRAFVTGAAGQVGRELVELLEARNRADDVIVAADRTMVDLADRDAEIGRAHV